MDITFLSAIGYTGLGMLLLGYFLLITDHLKADSTHFTLLNLTGGLLTILALLQGLPLPFLPVLLLWTALSLFGFFHHRMTATA